MSLLTNLELDRLIAEMPAFLHTVLGQVTPTDRAIYYWATKEYYSGKGTIVDAGALVGSTAVLLGEGLSNNSNADLSKKQIFSYDLFEDEPDGYMATVIKDWYPDDDQSGEVFDFLRYFKKNTQKYEPFIEVVKGDLVENDYQEKRDIEILSIDVAKNEELMLHCAQVFFPRLIPGKSLVLHQDYVFPYYPWILIAMELLSDYFEKVYDAPDFCTSVFICKKKITRKVIDDVLGKRVEDYFNIDNAKYMYQAIEKNQHYTGRFVHSVCLAYFYYKLGQAETAVHVGKRAMVEYSPTKELIENSGAQWFLKDFLHLNV